MNTKVDSITTENIRKKDTESVRLCPVCNYLGKFEPFGVERPRQNARCPGCGSIERARLYYLYLLSTNYFSEESCRVLHAVPEQCIRYKINRVSNIEYHSHGLEELEKTEYENNSVDVIIANHVLDRVRDDLTVLKEFNRVLSKDGIALLSVYMKRDIESDLGAMPRRYGKDYIERVEKCGFDVEVISAEDLCGTTISYIYGIEPEEVIVVGRKKNGI